MRLRRTLALGVLALSGLADRTMAQSPNTYYPRPQQMQVQSYPYGQNFVPQPVYTQQPVYGPPTYVPQQVPVAPAPNMVSHPPVLPMRPTSPPVAAPTPIAPPPKAAPQEPIPTPPKAQSEQAPAETAPPTEVMVAAPTDYDGPPRQQLERFYIQGGYVFAQPRWNSNPSFAVATVTPAGIINIENPGGFALTSTGQRDFAFDWSLTPRLEMGFAFPGGFGLRARWMYFDQVANDRITRPDGATLIVGATPLGLQDGMSAGIAATADARLHLHNVDFEAMQEWRSGPISFYGSAGLRYAYLEQSYNYIEGIKADGGFDNLSYTSYFNGLGPTVAAETRRRFEGTGIAAFASTRGALLFGHYNQTATNSVVAFPTRTARRTEEDILPMTELELGLEWSARLSSGARLFVALGGYGQVWFGPGNSSDSSPVFTQDPLGPGARLPFVETNSQSRSDLGLVGMSLTVGLEF